MRRSMELLLQGTVLSFIRADNVEVVLDIVNHATQEQLMNNIWVFVSDLDNKEIVLGRPFKLKMRILTPK